MWIIKICPMCNNCNNTTPFAIHAEYSLDPIVYKLVYTEVPVTLKSSEIDWITNVGLIFKFTSLSTCFLRALGDFMCDKDPEGLGKTVNDIVDFFDFSQSDEEPEPGGSEDNGETLPAGTQSEDKIVGNVLRVFSKLQEAVHEEHFGNDFGDILDLFKTYTSNLTRDAEVHQLQSNQPDHSQPRDGLRASPTPAEAARPLAATNSRATLHNRAAGGGTGARLIPNTKHHLHPPQRCRPARGPWFNVRCASAVLNSSLVATEMQASLSDGPRTPPMPAKAAPRLRRVS
eukprot:gene9640-14967_t